MGRSGKFAVFHSAAEYHVAKEFPFTYQSSARGEVKGVSLDALCGAHIGLVPYSGGVYTGGKPMPILYDEPPAGLVICQACERLAVKRQGWRRVLSHLIHHRGGLRAASRSLGRLV